LHVSRFALPLCSTREPLIIFCRIRRYIRHDCLPVCKPSRRCCCAARDMGAYASSRDALDANPALQHCEPTRIIGPAGHAIGGEEGRRSRLPRCCRLTQTSSAPTARLPVSRQAVARHETTRDRALLREQGRIDPVAPTRRSVSTLVAPDALRGRGRSLAPPQDVRPLPHPRRIGPPAAPAAIGLRRQPGQAGSHPRALSARIRLTPRRPPHRASIATGELAVTGDA
jgi:hypothetical protein